MMDVEMVVFGVVEDGGLELGRGTCLLDCLEIGWIDDHAILML